MLEIVKLINRFFPELIPLLKQVKDPRHKSYVIYGNHILLMTRILSSILYISSMRKTSEEFNSEIIIENIGILCGEKDFFELPYWETINNYLKLFSSEELQNVVCQLVNRLLRSRAFDNWRIRNRYRQIIIDGTQLVSSRKELDGQYMFRIHKKGTAEEYKEYYYYVLEAKIVLQPKIIVSIMTEFVENTEPIFDKQDCELKAYKRLAKKIKETFPCLPICICADSQFACQSVFSDCKKKKWRYLMRLKKGRIPGVYEEYKTISKIENNFINNIEGQYSYATNINYQDNEVNVVGYEENNGRCFVFITDLPIKNKNVKTTVEQGRMRWKIENEGFNTQKRHGYNIEHMFSKNYQAFKNHYFLIQIGHMISQIIEACEKLWKKVKQSGEQKHRRLLEAFKTEKLKDYISELATKRYQIRFV